MSGFIEFGIVWNVLFWYKPQYFAVTEYGCNIVQACIVKERKSYNDQHILCLRSLTDLLQTFQTAIQKDILQKKIIAGISRDTKLRKNQNFCTFCFCMLHALNDLFCVVSGISYFNIRCNCSDLDKSIFHNDAILSLINKRLFLIIPKREEKAMSVCGL